MNLDLARVEYELELYCGFCGNKIKQENAVVNGKGQFRCPRDGNQLREKPRGESS